MCNTDLYELNQIFMYVYYNVSMTDWCRNDVKEAIKEHTGSGSLDLIPRRQIAVLECASIESGAGGIQKVRHKQGIIGCQFVWRWRPQDHTIF